MRSQGDPEVDPLRGSRDSAVPRDQLLGLENAAWHDRPGSYGREHGAEALKAGHECVVYDRAADAVRALAGEGAVAALRHNPTLDIRRPRIRFGRGPLDVEAAIQGVPADVLAAALFARFSSRGEAEFQNRVLAMRFAFGGHIEQQHV